MMPMTAPRIPENYTTIRTLTAPHRVATLRGMPSETLPEYRLKARNTSSTSENLIHSDETARRYGFAGALVPGVTLYAYATHPIVQALGPAWLARGTASVKFVKPVQDGEELTVTGEITEREVTGITARVTGRTGAGECVVASVTLPAGLPTPVNAALYPVAPLPAERPPVSREHLAGLAALGTPEAVYDAACAADYVERVSDDLPVYQGAAAWVHPAFFLQQANRALRDNVRVSPWIHVASVVRHLGGARVGETLVTRGRVRSLFEKKGRELVELDLLLVAGPSARPVAHIRHTAIYRLPVVD
jgi:acyl dehydratase